MTIHRPPTRPAAVQAPLSGWWYLGALLMLGTLLLYIAAWFVGDPTGRGLIIGPLMVALFMPLILRLRQSETRFDLAGIVFAGLGMKLIASYGRLFMVEHLYDGVGDSLRYDVNGARFAPQFRNFDFDVEVAGKIPGTGFLDVAAGVAYAIFGADVFTGYLVFGSLAFLGCWFFYWAFSTAVPDGDHKRYAILLFFWPSLVFWPSSTGKESWMIFSLGLASAGAAAALSRKPFGFAILSFGILAAAMPRPHIAIVVLAAAGMGLVMAAVFGAGAGGRKTTIITKTVGIVMLLLAFVILAPRVAEFLNIDDVDGEGLDAALAETQRRTTQGGSEFNSVAVSSPLDYPWAFTTVLFRPFPYEVRSAVSAISALEGLALLGLFAFSLNRLLRLPLALMRNAYMTYAASFAFMFAYVFSFIGNFGILARQRVQLLPFLFVLVSLPAVKRAVEERRPTMPGLAGRPPTAPSEPRPSPGVGVTVAPPRSSPPPR